MAAAVFVMLVVVVVVRRPSGLPAKPDLSDRTDSLRQAVGAADARARAWFDPFPGIAELGRVYHANSYENQARACWELLSREQPAEGRWPYYLADLARTAGDDAGMIAHVKETLRRDPTYAPGWLRLGDFAFKTGDHEEAAGAYRRRLALEAGDPYARLGLARIAMQQGRHDEARGALAELVRDVPGFSSAQNVYAELLARGGDEAGAARHRWQGTAATRFREAEDPWLLELRPHCFDIYQLVVWGSQEEQTGRADLGSALFERAIALAPDDPRPYAEYGQMLLDSGQPAKARDLLVRGIAQAPFTEKLHLRLSAALRSLGQAQDALANDQRALAHQPDSFEVLNSLGQSQTALGHLADAESSFQAALRHAPNAVVAQINLGLVYLKSGRRPEAKRLWETALATHPGYPRLRILLGGLALEDKRFDDAEHLIRPYFQQYPGNVQAQAMLGQLYLQRATAALDARDLAAAERWCTAGLAEVPDTAELLGMLGSVALQNGNVPKALEAMEACQRLRPGDPRAVLPLAMLYKELQRPADARRILNEARDWLRKNGGVEAARKIEAMLSTIPER